MRILPIIALLGASTQALNVTSIAHFTEGLLIGALQQEGLGDIVTCFGDVESVVVDIESAIKDFEEKSFDGTKSGIAEIGTTVKEIASILGDCKNIETDVEKLISMAESFSNPISFAWHVGKDLLVNGI